MDLDEAKKCLDICERFECRDHAFGDREVFWEYEGTDVAGGYFGPQGSSVWIYLFNPDGSKQAQISFGGKDALDLVKHGKLARVDRNDMQGEAIPTYRGA